jgi:hypothetical protein
VSFQIQADEPSAYAYGVPDGIAQFVSKSMRRREEVGPGGVGS